MPIWDPFEQIAAVSDNFQELDYFSVDHSLYRGFYRSLRHMSKPHYIVEESISYHFFPREGIHLLQK
ncbi:hypothetical protein Lalb_Chr09g0323341 [Lupinus albus]|uniref:Uncharacterized protein n=1 Tax=Lupinus albus TaxID=3870 RepID=A0A6A4PZF9_LUPAL|nr:hypothetical protein Lalb_Chr09g0323341 [Lupinus albus]